MKVRAPKTSNQSIREWLGTEREKIEGDGDRGLSSR